jgi:hypothetical protein
MSRMRAASTPGEARHRETAPVVARGILIDFAAARGVESMNAGECASMDDVRTALENQGMADFEFAPGDAVHVFIQR